MKKIYYYNRELKNNINPAREITDDDYEIKKLSIQIDDIDLDHYTNVIQSSYIQFGEMTIEDVLDIPTIQPTSDSTIADLQNQLLETQAAFTDLIPTILINKEGDV